MRLIPTMTALTTNAGEEDKSLDTDTVHTLLSVKRRRDALQILGEHGSLEKGKLATLVACEEYDKEPTELESDERKRVLVALHQCHGSKLEDAGVIEIERDVYKLTPKAEELLWYIEAEPSQSFKEQFRETVSNLF